MPASVMLFVGGTSSGVALCLIGMMLVHFWRTRLMARCQARGSSSIPETDRVPRSGHAIAPWVGVFVSQSVLVLAVLLSYGLFATFAVAQPTLEHVDPVIFSALQASLLLPLSLILLGWTWRPSTHASVRLGLIGGIPLSLVCVCVALSLHTLGIIPSAMLTALDGLIASLLSWLVFRRPLSVWTCLAAGCACGGAMLLWWIAPSHWQTDLIALACGLLFTLYAFYIEHHTTLLQGWRAHLLPFFGGLFCSISLFTLALALCFGCWDSLLELTTPDLGVILYCGLATVLLPQVLLTLVLRRTNAVTIAFCAVIEPLLSIGVASLWGTISLPLAGWWGVVLIFLSLILQASASRWETRTSVLLSRRSQGAPYASPAAIPTERMELP